MFHMFILTTTNLQKNFKYTLPHLTYHPTKIMSIFTFFLISIVTFFTPLLTSAQLCNNADMLTLLKLKHSFGNPSELASWSPDRASDCCSSWRGVGCDSNGRISSVGVFYANVSGSIPSFISDLSALTIINFYSLPNLTGTIPSSITKLTSLTQITIAKTGLSGTIPTVLCEFKNLGYLDLSGNQFTGTIPDCLFARALLLTGNKLNGEVPKSFGNFNFETIHLSQNELVGDPSFLFGEGKSLCKGINLSWNKFKFDLSKVRFPLFLEELDVSHNSIYGSIPAQITKLTKLRLLDVSFNKLCGAIPYMKAFSELPLAFQHNKCLCGAPLSPCKKAVHL